MAWVNNAPYKDPLRSRKRICLSDVRQLKARGFGSRLTYKWGRSDTTIRPFLLHRSPFTAYSMQRKVVLMFQKYLLIVCLTICLPNFAQAANRMGLVIGNDNYANVPILEKARNDAQAITDTLTELGFEITRVLDANRRDMNRAIAGFTAKLQPGDTAFIFYAGHGVEIGGENYLLPVDIEAPETASKDFIKFESIGLSDVLQRVQSTGARITLMFIDACRDNPFAQKTGRSIGGSRGLGRVTAPEGTFVVFSAGTRQRALDRLSGPDPDPNSVFTRTLLPKLKEPGLELRQLVSDVRLRVRDLALQQNHQQFPAYYDELLGKFFFNAAAAAGTPPKPVPAISKAVPTNPKDDALEADYARAVSLNTVVAYEAFLEKHEGKEDLVITIATRQLDQLRDEVQPIDPDIGFTQPPQEPTDVSRKEIIRLTQQRLNALGCSAGYADGVSGPRTSRAFQAFIDGSGAALGMSDLGSQTALDLLYDTRGNICDAVALQTPPNAKQTTMTETPNEAPQKKSLLAGTWSFKASCPLFISATGTTHYRALGGGKYALATEDNLGNSATGTMTELANGVLQNRVVWQTGAKDNYSSRISADRRTITGTSSVGCRFTARR